MRGLESSYILPMKQRFPLKYIPDPKLQCLHESFLNTQAGVKVLDYGAGPVIASTISAATKASEIILADYIEHNCFSLRQWLNCDPQAFDWSPYISYVVETLEEKNDLDGKVRQQQVRGLVKAVVHCDITQDPPIEEGHNQLYDVVMCSLVVEGASSTEDDYCSNNKAAWHTSKTWRENILLRS